VTGPIPVTPTTLVRGDARAARRQVAQLVARMNRLNHETAKDLGDSIAKIAFRLHQRITKDYLSRPGRGRAVRPRYVRSKATRDIRSLLRGAQGPIGFRGGIRRVSVPGDPPAVDTGLLRASVAFTRTGPLTAAVATAVHYAPHLEYGTKQARRTNLRFRRGPISARRRLLEQIRSTGGGGIAPRPFFRPALRDELPAMNSILLNDMRRSLLAVIRGVA
jgi:hypothetical protein